MISTSSNPDQLEVAAPSQKSILLNVRVNQPMPVFHCFLCEKGREENRDLSWVFVFTLCIVSELVTPRSRLKSSQKSTCQSSKENLVRSRLLHMLVHLDAAILQLIPLKTNVCWSKQMLSSYWICFHVVVYCVSGNHLEGDFLSAQVLTKTCIPYFNRRAKWSIYSFRV